MLLHTFFIVKKRIDVTKIVTDLSLYRKYWIDFTWGVTNVARSRCTCSGAGASWSRRKVCARNDICAQQFSETGPWRTFVLLYDLRRSAKASYIVSRACERSRLSERFSASSIFWSALPRLLLNGRAINYVNQKGHRASWWNDIGDIYRGYIQSIFANKVSLSSLLFSTWAASISFQFHICYFWNYYCFKEVPLSNFED